MSMMEAVEKDGFYEVRIKNIYDPSKFWLILKFRELEIFMRYLKLFYSSRTKRKGIPRHDFKKGLLCVVNRNEMYYRAIILPVLLPDNEKVRVMMIDFGLIVDVNIKEVFYISKLHAEIPRFAVRASLAYIEPFDSTQPWNASDLKVFCELIVGKKLVAHVCEFDRDRKVLYIDLYRINGANSESINNILFQQNIASHTKLCDESETEMLTNYKAKVKYLHLFPSFEALENGRVPCSLWEHSLLKDSVHLDILYKDYYMYRGGSSN